MSIYIISIISLDYSPGTCYPHATYAAPVETTERATMPDDKRQTKHEPSSPQPLRKGTPRITRTINIGVELDDAMWDEAQQQRRLRGHPVSKRELAEEYLQAGLARTQEARTRGEVVPEAIEEVKGGDLRTITLDPALDDELSAETLTQRRERGRQLGFRMTKRVLVETYLREGLMRSRTERPS